MEEVIKAFAPLAAFFAVLFPFVLPAVISITQRIKADVIPDAKAWQVWVVSITLGILATHAEALVFGRMGLPVPDTISTTVFGLIVGLAASGLVDLSKLVAGTKT